MFARVSVYEIPADRMGEATSEFQEALEQISKLDGSMKHFVSWPPKTTATTLWIRTHFRLSS